MLGAGIKEARTAAYLRKFDEAEKLYLVANRRDLAVGLRAQLGDWFKVERYIPDSTSCTITSKEALHNIGNYYFERRRWIKATGYYLRAGNLEKLLKCFYAVEDFVEFVRLLPNFHEGCRELSDIGVLLGSVGLCKDAVFAFSRGKNIKKANNVCSLLGDWGQAAVLAKHHDFIKIDASALPFFKFPLATLLSRCAPFNIFCFRFMLNIFFKTKWLLIQCNSIAEQINTKSFSC